MLIENDPPASCYFSEEVQERFATITGDWNPMHMDPVAARRTQAGAPVVHGIHTLLWALDQLATTIPGFDRIRRVKTHFYKWVFVNSTAHLVIVSSTDTEIKAHILMGDIVTANVSVMLGPERTTFGSVQARNRSDQPISRTANKLSFEDAAMQSGLVEVIARDEVIVQIFPYLSAVIHPRRVAALGALSTLVGMKCPGLYSIFSGLNIVFDTEIAGCGGIAYEVKSTVERLRMVNLDVQGCGITGVVETFVRVPPAIQMSMRDVCSRINAAEFAGAHALVVGGSRGLGELTAKAIAAGGGKVTITYSLGKEEAQNVALEIERSGGSCDVIAYDARRPALKQLESLIPTVTHAYYYATGQIFRTKRGIFAQAVYQEFNDFYVKGFFELCESLEASAKGDVSVFYPSSVAVVDRPAGMTEYAMAKAAGELLCEDITRYMKKVRVVVSRLPRLPTDQTLSVVPVKCSEPIDVILPIIREVQRAEKNPS